MKTKMFKKIATFISTLFLLLVASTNNAYAGVNIPVKLNTSMTPLNIETQKTTSSGWVNAGSRLCNNDATPALVDYTGVRFSLPYWAYTKDDYVQITFMFYNWSNNNSVDSNFQVNFSNNNNFRVADISGEYMGNAGYLVKITLKIENNFTGDGGYISFFNNGNPVLTMKSYECMILSGISYWQVVEGQGGGGDTTAIINAINNQTTQIYGKLNDSLTTQNLIYDQVRNMNQSIQQEQQLQQAMNEQAEQTAEQAEQTATQAGNDAEQGTATMFQTMGNIIGAITDTPAGDCTISGDLGHMNMGTLNFCQGEIGPLRPVIQAVIYLVMAIATFTILMWVIGSIAELINWVQTGVENKQQ